MTPYIYVLFQHWPDSFEFHGAYREKHTAMRKGQLILNKSLVIWENDDEANTSKTYGSRKTYFLEIRRVPLIADFEV